MTLENPEPTSRPPAPAEPRAGGRPASRRFSPSAWTERLVPVVLVILALALLLSLAVVILSVLGLTPAF